MRDQRSAPVARERIRRHELGSSIVVDRPVRTNQYTRLLLSLVAGHATNTIYSSGDGRLEIR
jgi:hypothetical protein